MKDYRTLFKELWDKLEGHPDKMIQIGTNRGSMSKDMVLEDLSQATSDVVIISNSYRDDFWGNRIANALSNLSQKGVKITLIGGPQVLSDKAINNKISSLDRHDTIELYVSAIQPDLGARLIDEKISFLSTIPSYEPESELDGRQFMRALKYEECLVEIVKSLKTDLMKESSRYPHVCPNDEVPEDALNYFESTAGKHSKQLRDILAGIN